MFELYAFNTIVLFFVAHNSYIVDLGNKILNILNDIKLLFASVSTLYTMQVHLWLVLDSSLVNMTYFTLSRLIYFTLTTSKLLSCSPGLPTCKTSSWSIPCIIFLPCQSCCCHLIDFHTTLKWFCFLYPHFLPFAGHCLGVP